MTLATILHALFMTVYTLSLIVISIFGFHRWVLLMLYYYNRHKVCKNTPELQEYPVVTVQLPICNEQAVVRRIIDHACRIDWPADKLEIQVLDDSSDIATSNLARESVSQWARSGVDITYIHRPDRVGYKAGNLAYGTERAKGEFLMIFDSDFMPRPNILKQTMPHFKDENICAVQSRWEHFNRDNSLLTSSEAILLDGHFMIEQVARNTSERFITFNGTGGVWRRSAIADAGGWQFDTLTEDMDLSYRAQLRGWRILYLPHLTSPAELPDSINAFKSQQHRWTKGAIQTALKMLPRVWLSDESLWVKIEATFHLTSFSVHLFIVLLILLLYPAMGVQSVPIESGTLWRVVFDMSVFTMATMSTGAFYLCGQGEQRRSWLKALLHMPLIMALGAGISLSNAKAAIEALMGHKSEFVCTPKLGELAGTKAARTLPKSKSSLWLNMFELVIGVYLGICAFWSFAEPRYMMGAGFLVLFSGGFTYVAVGGILSDLRGYLNREKPSRAPTPARADAALGK